MKSSIPERIFTKLLIWSYIDAGAILAGVFTPFAGVAHIIIVSLLSLGELAVYHRRVGEYYNREYSRYFSRRM